METLLPELHLKPLAVHLHNHLHSMDAELQTNDATQTKPRILLEQISEIRTAFSQIAAHPDLLHQPSSVIRASKEVHAVTRILLRSNRIFATVKEFRAWVLTALDTTEASADMPEPLRPLVGEIRETFSGPVSSNPPAVPDGAVPSFPFRPSGDVHSAVHMLADVFPGRVGEWIDDELLLAAATDDIRAALHIINLRLQQIDPSKKNTPGSWHLWKNLQQVLASYLMNGAITFRHLNELQSWFLQILDTASTDEEVAVADKLRAGLTFADDSIPKIRS